LHTLWLSFLPAAAVPSPTLDATTGDTLNASLKAMTAGMSADDAAKLNRAATGLVMQDLLTKTVQDSLSEFSKAAVNGSNLPDPSEEGQSWSSDMLAIVRAKEQGKTAGEIMAMANAAGIN
jgi:hypothetical protein